MEENTELITFVGVSESETKSKFEDVEISSLEEKVDLENLVIYPSEPYINERLGEEHLHNFLSFQSGELFKKYENFGIKSEPLENEINNDISVKANELPHHNYEKSPIEFSRNVPKEQKFKALFCFLCSLQFDRKSVYDLHQSLVHGSKSEDSEVKIEVVSEISETINDSQTSTLPQVHKEKKKSYDTGKKLLPCNICGKTFSHKGHLNVHIESVHEGKNHSNVIYVMQLFLTKQI